MSTTVFENHGAPANATNLPRLEDLMRTVPDYIIETAFGDMGLTVSPNVQETARQLTICALASWIQPTPLTFTIGREDIPASVMAFTAYLLSKNWMMQVGNGELDSVRIPALRCTDSDRRTYSAITLRALTRDLSDVGYVRSAMEQATREIKPFANTERLLDVLGRCGGLTFMRSAALLLQAGEC